MTTTDELLALIDRLEDLLERSDLAELEVRAGDLGILLRKPGAQASGVAADQTAGPPAQGPSGAGHREGTAREPAAPGRQPTAAEPEPATNNHLVLAPLTGVFYGSPSPDAAPYVRVGSEVVSGQVIGLIEAMKLFNEIKSDASGRVVRIHAPNGTLVRAKQPLVEIETP